MQMSVFIPPVTYYCCVDRETPEYTAINVNVHVYSPNILVGSADCTIYTPGIGTHSFAGSSPLGI